MKDYTMRLNVWIKILVFINNFNREVVEINFFLHIFYLIKITQWSPDTWGRYKKAASVQELHVQFLYLEQNNWLLTYKIRPNSGFQFNLLHNCWEFYCALNDDFFPHECKFTLIDNYVTQNYIHCIYKGRKIFPNLTRHATNYLCDCKKPDIPFTSYLIF